MELTQAIDVLKGEHKSKLDEANALQLAISILEGTFTPELTVLDSARTEIEQKETLLAEKQAEIDTLKAELDKNKPTPISSEITGN